MSTISKGRAPKSLTLPCLLALLAGLFLLDSMVSAQSFQKDATDKENAKFLDRALRNPGRSLNAEDELEIPKVATDANLFALRLIAHLSNRLTVNPYGDSGAELMVAAEGDLRALKQFARENGKVIHVNIEEMADNVRKSVRALRKFDKEADKIVAAWEKKQKELASKTDTEAAMAGIDVAQGSSGDLLTDLVSLLIKGVVVVFRSDSSLNAAKAKHVKEWNAAVEKCRETLDEMNKENKKLALELSQRYEWREGEVGYDVTDEEAKAYSSSTERVRALEAWRKRRPRDPFLIAEYCNAKSRQGSLESREAAQLVSLCFEAVAQVPDRAAFHRYRAGFLALAGDIASRAASNELFAAKKARFDSDIPIAHEAVKIWTLLHKLTKDPTGEFRARKGIALAMSGKFKEGHRLLQDIEPLRKKVKCPSFAYCYAAMWSRAGNAEKALIWFQYGVDECGFTSAHYRWLQADRDMVTLRGECTKELEALGEKLRSR